ncbi:hypothetical protein ACHCAI_003828 [Enterobacter asburiae]
MSIRNGNANSTFSLDAWEKSALCGLESLQNKVSKALVKYQSNTDKTALGEAANSGMDELKATVMRIVKATPAIQQKVDDIADMLNLMAQFSGITFDD